MNLFITTVSFLLLLSAGKCQSQVDIIRIEFTTMTRGYQKQLFISQDSATRIVEGRQTDNTVIKRKVTEEEWRSFISSLETVHVMEIPDLPSPTAKRAFDGARFSTLKIISRDGQEWQHGFDNEDPHDKLQPLMDLIVEFEKKFPTP